MIKIGLKTTVFSLLTLILFSCGHQKKPTGGPKDTVKPEISSIIPAEYQQLDNKLEIIFSKPIKKSTIYTAIRFYPSISNKKYIWEGNKLTILFKENLQDNTNYFVSFSTSIKGIHQNPLDKKYLFTFKHGLLQDYSIYGNITYEKLEDAGKDISLTLFSADSIIVFNKMINGDSYKLDYLNDMPYLLKTSVDKNKKAFCEINVTDSNRTFANLNIAYSDTTKPTLKKLKTRSNTQLDLILSEPIKSFTNLFITTIDSNQTILPIVATEIIEDTLKIITQRQDTLKYILKIYDITDMKNNKTDYDSLFFNYSSLPDTINPKVIAITPTNGIVIKNSHPIINVKLSELILSQNITAKLVANENAREYPLKVTQKNLMEYEFRPKKILINYSSYKIKISLKDFAENKSEFESNFMLIEEGK